MPYDQQAAMSDVLGAAGGGAPAEMAAPAPGGGSMAETFMQAVGAPDVDSALMALEQIRAELMAMAGADQGPAMEAPVPQQGMPV
jgi:hypothetical protein